MSNSGFNCASDFVTYLSPRCFLHNSGETETITSFRCLRWDELFRLVNGFPDFYPKRVEKLDLFFEWRNWSLVKILRIFLEKLQPGKNQPTWIFKKKQNCNLPSCRCLPRSSSCRRSWSSATWSVAPWLGLHCLKVKYDEIGKLWGTVSSTTPRCQNYT